ncbi:hypothetical protein RRF57_008714 [Xylaria bambusicola]|uniref:Uncharacterized protein n=1 Tax=Xylaria bambusicola TaxID=326684 RepID=A0AAN7UIC0_9PEZI
MKTAKRKTAGKAPGLHSPATLLAVLIIGHPDPDAKFRSWIGRLGVDWMIQPRDVLNVQQGFWTGINSDNLYAVFAQDDDEVRKSQAKLSADYDRIFGKDFMRCRRDIRPYLPKALSSQLTPLTEKPLYTDDEHDEDVYEAPDDIEISETREIPKALEVQQCKMSTIYQFRQNRHAGSRHALLARALPKRLYPTRT